MDIILVGGGTSAFLFFDIINEDPENRIRGYCARERSPDLCYDYLGPPDQVFESESNKQTRAKFVLAVTNDNLRRFYYQRLRRKGLEIIPVISKHSNISPSATIGIGCHIGAFTTIFANAKIGDGASIEDHCSVGINVEVGDFSILCPGVMTGSKSVIGDDCFIGLGVCLNPGVTIANNCLIGSGSIVVKDIPESKVAKGAPCKAFKDRPLPTFD